MRRAVSIILGWALVAGAAVAAKIGDPAAPLKVADWIKLGPVSLADGKGKTVYVVEFWATWCGPCRESIPHLSKLQAKFKDQGVVVVGITDEKPAEVKRFVEQMGAKMEYAVGVDRQNRTAKAYLDAYGQDGIPTAFVVDQTGAVVWVGYPLDGLDEVLERVVAGTFDPQSPPTVAKDDAAEDDPVQEAYFEEAERRSGQAAAAAGEEVLREHADNADRLNEFAWRILTDETLQQRDYPLALRAARRAMEKTGGKQFAILDTYARAMLMTGHTNEAVVLQERAIALCADPKTRLELKETLADYQHPAPESGLDDNGRMRQFVNASLALLETNRAVPVVRLLAETDLAPCRVKLAKPSTRPVTNEHLYEQARESVIVVGTLTKNEETEDWEPAVATGFIIHESGIFVTNFHVLDVPGAAIMTAMTCDGQVYPVKSVLAVSPFGDIAICQLAGAAGLKPLALVPNAKPGARIRVLSHPDKAFYSFTEGVLSRYFIRREEGKTTTVLTTTAEFAVGSSGGPLLDECGNVVGMVAATATVYSGPADATGEAPAKQTSAAGTDPGDLQMVIKMCVPAADILKLVTSGPAKP